jgi:hypothetical protein
MGQAMVLLRRTLPATYGTSTIRKKGRLLDGTDSFVLTRYGLIPMAFYTARPQEQSHNQPRLLRPLPNPVRRPHPRCSYLRIKTVSIESDSLLRGPAETEDPASFYKAARALKSGLLLITAI